MKEVYTESNLWDISWGIGNTDHQARLRHSMMASNVDLHTSFASLKLFKVICTGEIHIFWKTTLTL